jgi:hypothetical protein
MSESQLVHWAQARGLELTPDNRPVVARYLRRARLLPTLGALAGVLFPTLVELVWHGELVILGFHSDGSGAPYAGPFEAYITSPSLVAADDAIRAQSVHAVAGSGLALLLVALSGIFAVLGVSDVDLLNWTMWLPALAAFVLSILACRDIGQQPWHVRRRVDRRAGAAPA